MLSTGGCINQCLPVLSLSLHGQNARSPFTFPPSRTNFELTLQLNILLQAPILFSLSDARHYSERRRVNAVLQKTFWSLHPPAASPCRLGVGDANNPSKQILQGERRGPRNGALCCGALSAAGAHPAVVGQAGCSRALRAELLLFSQPAS